MNHAELNRIRVQILKDPAIIDFDEILTELNKPGSDPQRQDPILLQQLLRTRNKIALESNPTSPLHDNQNQTTLNNLPIREGSRQQNLPEAQSTLKLPASGQWCFINGLSDMEWMKNRCIRQCLESRLLHAQALPSPDRFKVTITGKFQREPGLSIHTPFHRLRYRVKSETTIEEGGWKTFIYCCSKEGDGGGDSGMDIIYEIDFSVTPGDYFFELNYTL